MTEGMVQKGALLEIIADVVVQRRSGDVHCQKMREEKHLYFKEGELVFAATNMDADRIGQILLARHGLDPNILQAVLSTVGPGKRTGRILVMEGVLSPEDLVRAVEMFIRKVAVSIFAWREGRVRFVEGDNPSIEDVTIEIDTADVLIDGCRHMPLASVAVQAIKNLQEPLQFSMDPTLRFQKVRFTPEEATVLGCINNATTTEEICQVSPLDRDATLKFIAGLIAAGIIEAPLPAAPRAVVTAPAPAAEGTFEFPDDLFGEPLVTDETQPIPGPAPAQRRAARAPAALPPRPKPGAPAAAPPRVAPQDATPLEEPFEEEAAPPQPDSAPAPQRNPELEAAERGQIQEVYRRLSLMDYYMLLEVDKRSSDEEIKKSYFALAKKYHPDRSAARHLKDLKPAMEAIFAQINKGYEVLKDPDRRKQYDQSGSRSPVEEQREGVSKETDEQIADRNFRMSKTLYDQRKYAEAIVLLKQSIRLNPAKGNYHFLLANALTKNGNRREAEETYLKAIELDRFNSDIYVSLGLLYKASNMLKRAEGMFNRALQLNDNHPVALRELQSMRPEDKGLMKFLKKASKLQPGK